MCMRITDWRPYMPRLLPIVIALTTLLGCQSRNARFEAAAKVENPEFFLPAGDAEAGRKAFTDLRCNVCHRVMWGGFAVPTAPTQGPILSTDHAGWSSAKLASAIIAPSHSLSPEWKNVPGGVSPMGDYDNVMTIRQLSDIVAFVQSIR